MKQILFISHSCFPVNGAEEIVNIRLLSALSKSGQFKIDVLTKKKKSVIYPSDSLEEYGVKVESLQMIEVDNRITPATIWQHTLTLLRFGVVHKGDHWAAKALPTAIRLCRENNYDYILTRAAPAYYIGYYLKRTFGIKWVCTLNDPTPSEIYPAPYGHGNGDEMKKKYKREFKMMKDADAFIYPNVRLARYMNRVLQVDETHIHIIPHVLMGNVKESKRFEGEVLKLIHSGNCTNPRRAENLLEALKELVEEKKVTQEMLRLTFLGRLNKWEEGLLKDYRIEKMVDVLEPVTYLKSLKALQNYDVAVIIEAPCDEGVFLPTKVSDFMTEGKRIFAISPRKGLMYDMYQEGYISYFADVTDVQSIKTAIVRMLSDSKKKGWNDYKVNVPKEYQPEYVVGKYMRL